MKNFLVLLTLGFNMATAAANVTEMPFLDSINTIKRDPRIAVELRKYSDEGSHLPDSYIQELTTKMKSRIFGDQKQWLNNPKCAPSAKVKFLSQKEVFNRVDYPNVEEDTIGVFESGFIRIEASGCLNTSSPEKALAEYMKPEFQKEAISELKAPSELKGDLTCEKTYVFSIGDSDYCYNKEINRDVENGIVSLHTYNLTNAPVNKADAPVYFRELLFVFKKVSPNTVAANVVVYVRGPVISGFIKGVAGPRIEKGQTKLFEMLNKRLR